MENPENLTIKQLEEIDPYNLKTLRAYNIKLSLQEFYKITDPEAAEAHLKKFFLGYSQ